MKILVLSDSHGAVDTMARIVEIEQPHHVLHLGDCTRDLDALREVFPTLSMTGVAGNCDFDVLERNEKLIELGGKRILMLHGHTRGVKMSAQRAIYAALELSADVLLFGHTHIPLVDRAGELTIMNPGTCSRQGRVTYGLITIENGKLDCRTAVL